MKFVLSVALGCLALASAGRGQTPNWERVMHAASPSFRSGAAMAYDPVRRRSVLFGGAGDRRNVGDTWEWDGLAWSLATPTNSPSVRYWPAMVYDSARRHMLLFGGSSSTGQPLADTWVWDGASWTQVTPATFPTAGYGHAMVFDITSGRTLLPRSGPGRVAQAPRPSGADRPAG